ncbi:MAG: hypothetical protein MUO77_00310, partial [Anaerolineales bacterium]|nr:hypothetical protein [Anaerolineales bacterium]
QARAFGLGLLLATQNPVDVDYKALSNAGTWFIGKLQTEQDKNRLLDGLESASGGLSRSAMDTAISSLGKRVFVLHNVHEKAPVLFQTRWAMNFLAGPLTRTQIPDLNKLAGVDVGASIAWTQTPKTESASSSARSDSSSAPVPVVLSPSKDAPVNRPAATSVVTGDGSQTKPPVPSGISEYYLPQNYSLPEAFSSAKRSMPAQAMKQGVIYRPALLAAAQVRFLDRKFGVDVNQTRAALVESIERSGVIRWEDFDYAGDIEKIESAPTPQARFGMIDAPLNDTKRMTALQKDFADWVYRGSTVTARANQKLKVFAGPDVTQAEFMKTCADVARDARDAEIEKKTAQVERKIKSLEDKLGREERELRQDESDLQNRKLEAGANLLELGAGMLGFGRKKSVSTQFTKHRLSKQAEENVQESVDAIAQYKKDIADLQREREEIVAQVNDDWGNVVNDVDEVTITPKKTDIYVKLFGVAWTPYYIVQAGSETLELPAFGIE